MTSTFTIIARIAAKPENTEAVKAELLKMLEPTHREAGCDHYALHQDNENPAVFWFYEIWKTRHDFESHTQTKHFLAMFQAIEPLSEEITLNEMSRLGG